MFKLRESAESSFPSSDSYFLFRLYFRPIKICITSLNRKKKIDCSKDEKFRIGEKINRDSCKKKRTNGNSKARLIALHPIRRIESYASFSMSSISLSSLSVNSFCRSGHEMLFDRSIATLIPNNSNGLIAGN